MRHHTKDKGDIGVGFVIADALRSGFQVAVLLSEHLPFDVILISPEMKLCRVSVKYRTAVDGVIGLQYRSTWSDRHGVHTKPADLAEFDATAIFCPDNGTVYYILNTEIHGTRGIGLRLFPTRNNQTKGVRLAKDFEGAGRLFEKKVTEEA